MRRRITRHLDERTLRVVGWIATVLNTCLWAAYGWLHKDKHWPIIVANIPGIILGATCLYTAL